MTFPLVLLRILVTFRKNNDDIIHSEALRVFLQAGNQISISLWEWC